MIPTVYKEFIIDLTSKTDTQIIKWSQTDDEAFTLKSKNNSVTISYYHDEDSMLSYYTFNFINLVSKNSSGFRVSSEENDYKTMEELYLCASASANNIKDELDNFF